MAKHLKTSAEQESSAGIRPRSGKYSNRRIADSGTIQADAREKVFDRAVEVIENEERALRWMGTPVRALGFATPVSLLGTAKGRSAVLKVLGQLEHAVW